MKANGVNVIKLNTRLSEKIEELTLHVLQQKKRIEALETGEEPPSQSQKCQVSLTNRSLTGTTDLNAPCHTAAKVVGNEAACQAHNSYDTVISTLDDVDFTAFQAATANLFKGCAQSHREACGLLKALNFHFLHCGHNLQEPQMCKTCRMLCQDVGQQ